jgi:hypothetical protein
MLMLSRLGGRVKRRVEEGRTSRRRRRRSKCD